MNVNFKSRLIGSYPVVGSNNPHSFVELFPSAGNDCLLAKKLANSWDGDVRYMYQIANEMGHYRANPMLLKNSNKKFLGLTAQNDEFGYLYADNMDGVAQLSLNGRYKCDIDFVEISPKYNEKIKDGNFNPLYKNFIEILAQYFKNRDLAVNALASEVEPYERLGFKQTGKWLYKNVIQRLEKPAVCIKP